MRTSKEFSTERYSSGTGDNCAQSHQNKEELHFGIFKFLRRTVRFENNFHFDEFRDWFITFYRK